MREDYFTAHAVDLQDLRPALGQTPTCALRKLHELFERELEAVYTRLYLNVKCSTWQFNMFRQLYESGYKRAIYDIMQDIETELNRREN